MSILPLYLVITIVIGWASKRLVTGSNDFLNASRALPVWAVAGAFLSANCGALEIVGLSAVAAQYGVLAFHFYWIGAIPAMLFLGGVMIPIYLRSGVKSLPEYLEKRYDARVRLLNAWLILCTITALSGIEIYAMAEVLNVEFNWPFAVSACLSAGVVMIYVVIGGLRATVYNELFQLAIIVIGLLPLLFRTRIALDGFTSRAGPHWHLWTGLPLVSPHGRLDGIAVIIGLGFVLSFSYWCTDFVQIQRALAAKSIQDARLVPLLAGFGKLAFSLIVVVPALGAGSYLGSRMPASYNQILPALMASSYGPILLGLGITALLASLMSGLAANVTAFSAVWTQEIYRPYLRKGAPETHYIGMGRTSAIVAALLSIATSYLAIHFRDLMEYIQLIFSLFAAPFFAVFLMGMFTRKATSTGAIAGLISGVAVAFTYQLLVAFGLFTHGSLMSTNFHTAICAFAMSLAVGLLSSTTAQRRPDEEIAHLIFDYRGYHKHLRLSPTWWILAGLLVAMCAGLNYAWR